MNRIRANSGNAFYRLLVRCLAEQHQPTDEEIDLVAGKIWHESYESQTGQPWVEVVPDSMTHRQMIGAAKIALRPELRCEWGLDKAVPDCAMFVGNGGLWRRGGFRAAGQRS